MRSFYASVLAACSLLPLLSACASTSESPHATATASITPVAATATPTASAIATPTSTATATPTITATATPDTRTTGIPGLDEIIAAARRGDIDALRQKLRYRTIACAPPQPGIGGPPFCRPGEPDGTLIDALPGANCEGYYSRPDEITLTSLAADNTLYAVYRVAPGAPLPGRYVAIFHRPASAKPTFPFGLVTDETAITGIYYGCEQKPEDFVQLYNLTDLVLPPSPAPAR